MGIVVRRPLLIVGLHLAGSSLVGGGIWSVFRKLLVCGGGWCSRHRILYQQAPTIFCLTISRLALFPSLHFADRRQTDVRIKTIPHCSFWATVCKTFRLCYRTVVCPELSCLSVTFVHCGQTVGWIKMKLGMQVGLGPGHIVLDE